MKNKKALTNNTTLRVVELFAGVGGFRIGLKEPNYEVVWFNQWEPSTKIQHAHDIYIKRFCDGKAPKHSNEDINIVKTKDIPTHDVLVGGFPCQDYSVAKPLKQADGIKGKKGVLWWQIHRILVEKKIKPKYLILENVDRLLKSPANQRGRDFAIIIASLSDLGYAVEWRVINAADYGFPQRRRRIFILGYHKSSVLYKKLSEDMKLAEWVFNDGVFAKAFPIQKSESLLFPEWEIKGTLPDISENFNKDNKRKLNFENSGVMIKRTVLPIKTKPAYMGKFSKLGDVLEPDEKIPEEYFIEKEEIPKWKYLKGEKHIIKTSLKTNKTFKYDEGAMVFPDSKNQPSRTIVTGEGGSGPSRFKHVIETGNGRLRRLIPVELEKLNMFPPNHTSGVPDTKRAFLMGNAIVVGVVEKIGDQLVKSIIEIPSKLR